MLSKASKIKRKAVLSTLAALHACRPNAMAGAAQMVHCLQSAARCCCRFLEKMEKRINA